jgi:hypothetical protein
MRLVGTTHFAAPFTIIPGHLVAAESPLARTLSVKEVVQLAMRENPQRLIARLLVNQRVQDQTISRSALLPRPDCRPGISTCKASAADRIPHGSARSSQ